MAGAVGRPEAVAARSPDPSGHRFDVRRRLRVGLARRRAITGLALVLPALALAMTFFVVPVGFTVWISLNDWSLFGAHHFTGLANYRHAITDSSFAHALAFTAAFTAIVSAANLTVGFLLALLVRHPFRGVAFVRTAVFMPVVVGFPAASLLALWILNGQVGILNRIGMDLGVIDAPINWLGDANWALLMVTILTVWKTIGLTVLLLMAGMQAVPEELYEASKVDGAGLVERFRYITLPLMRKPIALVTILSLIIGFLTFDQFYILTQGGPNGSTLTVVYKIYRSAFVDYRLGYASTLSVSLMAILILLSGAQLFLLRDRTYAR